MTEAHANSRLEAFSDGVFAIALTLLIIDVKLPAAEGLVSSADVWRALQHLAPSVFAFLLSFVIILITWVNHHGMLKLITGSSALFIYANGFLLLTVVFMPFPAALLGEFLWTDRAAPAVVLFNALLAVQAIAWILLNGAAVGDRITKDDAAAVTIREGRRNGYFAFVLYAALTVTAFWFPLAIAGITTLSWIFWLALSLRMKHA